MEGGNEQSGRGWWRSRWGRAAGVLVLAVLGVRLAWGWWVGRQLRACLEEVRRRGEPVEVGDVKYPRVPESENAWELQQRAAQMVSASSPRSSNLEYRDYPPYEAVWMKMAEASERTNGAVFALMRQARGKSAVQFREKLTSPLANSLLPALNNAKRLANTLADGVVYAHVRVDDAEALERLLDLLHLSRSLRQDDSMVSQLVAIGIDALACDATLIVGPGVRLDGAAMTRQKIREVIERLLEEEIEAKGLRRSVMIERLVMVEDGRGLSQGTWFIRPVADRQMIRASRNLDIVIEASGCKSWPEAQAVLRKCSTDKLRAGPEVPRYSRWFSSIQVDLSAYFERYFRMVAERRAAAVVLACQLYRADRRRWPERLEELVPEYLGAIPADPFRRDGQAVGYVVLKGKLPGGGDRPLVYFLPDYGAREDAPIPNEPITGWRVDLRVGGSRAPIRQYRDVARWGAGDMAKSGGQGPK
ncbi:MAG: hypothetical protein ACM359_13075 [Bacillota bacterium]